MQAFKSHKTVQAAKIVDIELAGPEKYQLLVAEPDADSGTERVSVSLEWMVKHKPFVGGYYVEYSDGYSSYSPADAFENGYTPLSQAVEAENDAQRAISVANEGARAARDELELAISRCTDLEADKAALRSRIDIEAMLSRQAQAKAHELQEALEYAQGEYRKLVEQDVAKRQRITMLEQSEAQALIECRDERDELLESNRQLQERLAGYENGDLSYQIMEVQTELKAREDEISDLKHQLNGANEIHSSMASHIETLQKQLTASQRPDTNTEAELRSRLTQARTDFDRLRANIDAGETETQLELGRAQQTIRELRAELATVITQEDYTGAVQRGQKEADRLRAERDQFRADYNRLTNGGADIIAELRAKIDEMGAELASDGREIQRKNAAHWKQTAENAQAELKDALALRADAVADVNTMAERCNSLNDEIDELCALLVKVRTRRDKWRARFEAMQYEFFDLCAAYEAKRNDSFDPDENGECQCDECVAERAEAPTMAEQAAALGSLVEQDLAPEKLEGMAKMAEVITGGPIVELGGTYVPCGWQISSLGLSAIDPETHQATYIGQPVEAGTVLMEMQDGSQVIAEEGAKMLPGHRPGLILVKEIESDVFSWRERSPTPAKDESMFIVNRDTGQRYAVGDDIPAGHYTVHLRQGEDIANIGMVERTIMKARGEVEPDLNALLDNSPDRIAARAAQLDVTAEEEEAMKALPSYHLHPAHASPEIRIDRAPMPGAFMAMDGVKIDPAAAEPAPEAKPSPELGKPHGPTFERFIKFLNELQPTDYLGVPVKKAPSAGETMLATIIQAGADMIKADPKLYGEVRGIITNLAELFNVDLDAGSFWP